MKKLNLLLGILIALTILACSSDDNKEANIQNQIIGEWKEVRAVDFYSGTTFEFISDNCKQQSRQIFNQDGNYSFTIYRRNNSMDCELNYQSINGTWSESNGNYNFEVTYEDVITGEQFSSNETSDYDTREILIINDTLRIRYNDVDENGIINSSYFTDYIK